MQRIDQPWTAAEVSRLRRLWEAGLTANEIAEAMKRSRNSICGAARRYDLPRRPCPITRPDMITQRQHHLARQAAIDEIMRGTNEFAERYKAKQWG
jgi:hypothetical protein